MASSIEGSSELASRLECCSQVHCNCSTSERPLSVVTVVKNEPGGSQSRLVQCDDGKFYVLKMHPNPQGSNVLANEALGAILLRDLGLRAPRWRRIAIDLKAVRFFPDLAMHTSRGETVFPACGIHFGSEYVGGPQYDLYDFMPMSYMHKLRSRTQLLGIYLFDVWASHQDARQCLYQKLKGETLYDTFFIDNGHLFGGPEWSEVAGHCRGVCSLNIQPPLVEDPRIEQWLTLFENRIPKLLQHAIGTIPEEWYTDDIHMLCARLLWRLECIRALLKWEMLHGAPAHPSFK
jgi:hypothetical protein